MGAIRKKRGKINHDQTHPQKSERKREKIQELSVFGRDLLWKGIKKKICTQPI